MSTKQNKAIKPFKIAIPDEAIRDLHARLDAIRWPEKEPVTDWSQGAPLANVKALAKYWRTKYDWRRCEAVLNGYPQFKTTIDGLGIHFLHIRSANPNALPLLITHGWPGSVIEFLKIIGPLTDPAKYGGDPADSFHLVLPSLPGYGFSDKPSAAGWSVEHIAKAWHELMTRLGYGDKYVAQGGDWGSAIATAMGIQAPPGLAAINSNMPIVMPEAPYENLSAEESAMLQDMTQYQRWEAGYSTEHATRPQTIGYSLADSAIGQAAWIFEKFWAWTDCHGNPLNVLSYDELLDNIMMYWLTNTGASSARLYWESYFGAFGLKVINVPAGCSIFPKDIYKAPRSWVERAMPRLIYFNELDRGGHFAAFEQPELFAEEMRRCFRGIR